MGTEIEKINEQEQALVAAFQDDLPEENFILPILKTAQSNTSEVQNGDAQIGDFVNSLTGETYGNIIEFVVAGFEKGRFRSDDENNVICTGREGACGCHSVPYDECPESEEQWRVAVQRGDKEWGKGPPCATTYNFTGFIPGTEMPVRLSLMRSNAKAAKKLLTMLRFARTPWDQVFQIESHKTSGGGYTWQTVSIKQSRKTDASERQTAVNLATQLKQQDPTVVGDPAAEPEKPAEKPDGIEY